ncbi:MAG: RIP metalloprotease RseP [Micavibrio aeruginosavorus]|uniref:Zinc metalloprotease n=1 Tax=Micavibrio aeruginosavorus TaxID=349221 RepID=A0A7T5R0M7_9BACT|nr:MAG: RIP metalloprotease RseP [Micavibrio aeruginosavorus]
MQVFDTLHQFANSTWVYGGTFVLVLSVLVFVHEFGHYYVAKLCGVKIESFSIGFGKELFGFTDRHGTRWKFSLIPLGGYVKMFGDVDPASAGHSSEVTEDGHTRPHTLEERKVAFYAQHVAKRSAIVFAGPGINFLFAILVLWGLYMFYGQPSTPAMVAAVIKESAAHKAGFQPHDEILSIDGRPIRRFEEVRRNIALGLDSEKAFVVKRDGQIINIMVRPERVTEEDRFGFSNSRGFLGVVSPGNGIDVTKITEIDGVGYETPEAVRDKLAVSMDRPLVLTVDRSEKIEEFLVTPLAANNAGLSKEGDINYNHLVISKSDEEFFFQLAPMQALMVSIDETKNIVIDTLNAIGQMFTGDRSARELGGIIRIGAIAGDMARAGLIALITFTALLSINLGLINLFPIPMLDGGHLLFYSIEALKGSPISEQIQEYAFRLGLAFLAGIMVFANLNDLLQLFL